MQQTYKSIKSVKRGFTLVEMLIVLSIIGALTAASVSLYREVVENQRVTATIEVLNIYAQIHYAPKEMQVSPLYNAAGIKYLNDMAVFASRCGVSSSSRNYHQCSRGYPYRHGYIKDPHPNHFKGEKGEIRYGVGFNSLSKSACEKLVTRVFNLYEAILVNSTPVKNISDVPGRCVKIVGEASKNIYEKVGNVIHFYAVTE